MADTQYDDTDTTTKAGTEPATKHDVTEGGVLGAVGGAIVGALAGGPVGAVIGAIAGGAASAAAVDVVDKHDHDYPGTQTTNTTTTDATAAPAGYATTAAATDTYATASGTAGYGTTAATDTYGTAGTLTGATDVDGEVVLPVVEETLEVGKRQVQGGGARIHTETVETPVEQQVTLHEEHVTVDRRPVDRAVTDADLSGLGKRTYEITETAEVPVVAKEARVVEEVVVGKTATERTETIHDTVRRTDVEVEQVDGDRTRP